jgi:hypothetical protein
MKRKPRTAITQEEVSKALQPVRSLIPSDNFDQFLDQVHSAIEIYLDLDEPSMVAKELREINRICQKPNYTLLNVIGNASKQTIELLENMKPLPPLPSKDDDAGIDVLAKEIRQRIVVRGKLLSDRVGYGLIGPSTEGRPSKDRLKILVSFVAFAYVSATGKSYRRRWDSDANADLPFHQILETIFDVLCLEASADEAIRRQQILEYQSL